VENVIADVDSCAVIVESMTSEIPKRKKKEKRTISMEEILHGEDQIKAANERRMN
jgi:hypothetical protein